MTSTNFYQSDKWRSIDPLTRAEILLVSEGVKPATRTSENADKYFGFMTCLNYLGINITNVKFKKNEFVLTAYKDIKAFNDYYNSIVKPDLSTFDIHRANGRFYGYPDCCIDSYVGLNTGMSVPNQHNLETFDEQMPQREVLSYRVPSMTPCEPICKNALDLLAKYRDVLVGCDIEAARALRSFNNPIHSKID